MKLEDHYNELWKQSLQKFRKKEFDFDPLINSKDDNRYGITLLARPSEEVKQNILDMLHEIKKVAPNQYFYPNSDLHLTILSIISCYEGFTLDQIDQQNYRKIIQSAIKPISSFKIRFHGLTASPSCILIQGFPESNQLDKLRDELRNKIKQTDALHSIDQRYQLQTAHMTILRFRESFKHADTFIDKITLLSDRYFGSCVIDEIELVGNDWYQQQDKVKLIAKFSLNK